MALAFVLFAFPAAFAAMFVFASLQASRADMFDSMLAALRPDGPPDPSVPGAGWDHWRRVSGDATLPPTVAARYAGWLLNCGYDRAALSANPIPARSGVRAMLSARPEWVARSAMTLVGMFCAGAMLVGIGLFSLARLARVLPFALSPIQRFHVAVGAMRASWPWSAAAAVLAAAIAWHIGFDREGGKPLEEGVFPHWGQAVCLVAGWGVLSAVVAALFLPISLLRMGVGLADLLRCRRCGYSMRGLAGRHCPECGVGDPLLSVPPVNDRTPPRPHLGAIRRTLQTLLLLVALAGVAGTVNTGARDWLLLRPHAPTPIEAWLASDEPARHWRCAYGTLTISGVLRPPTPDVRDGIPFWAVSWNFQPSAHSPTKAASGTLGVSVTFQPDGSTEFHHHELPCGPVRFYSMRNSSCLFVGLPALIFDGRDVEYWRPQPGRRSTP